MIISNKREASNVYKPQHKEREPTKNHKLCSDEDICIQDSFDQPRLW